MTESRGMARLFVLNDERTPLEFVVDLLSSLFGKSASAAVEIAGATQASGRGEIGVYETRTADDLLRRAREHCANAGHSLAIVMEDAPSHTRACAFCGKTADGSAKGYAKQNAVICGDCILAAAAELDGASTRQQFKYAHEALSWHFAGLTKDSIITSARQFPARMRADLQSAVDALFTRRAVRFFGLNREDHYEAMTIASLMKVWQHSIVIAPLAYDEVDVGEPEPVRCLGNGLWLLGSGDERCAVLLTHFRDHFGTSSIRIEIAVPTGERGASLTSRCFRELEVTVQAAKSYRGKVLSLEHGHRYAGTAAGIMVHRLPPVRADEVVLPQATLELLDRNILQFARRRASLKNLGLSAKKGVLLYGPPGTGKTHTIRYLASNLPGHTTLLVTAEQVGILNEYFSLARLLEPSLLVIEDVDLIARDRQTMNTCEEVALNGLLNEMDGLKESADIFFVLTTNRPETLEAALASRPGRIDQAIEVPLPDDAGRAKLIRLYGRSLVLNDDIVDVAVRRTKGVSAAFIKELMRRIAQSNLEREGGGAVSDADTRQALEEMLFTGGRLNAKLLGASRYGFGDTIGLDTANEAAAE